MNDQEQFEELAANPKGGYISGPMTGYKDYNFPAFMEAEEQLVKWGFTDIINPARNFKGDTEKDYETYMRLDLANVARSSALFLLEGHDYSRGCAREKAVAR